ncbi:MAG: ABC transporter ATP-binding protein [Gammaproteobacteria bacterium]|nr:ABC transporter ATP-binding protein [Gammaproteobacteria bacterium]
MVEASEPRPGILSTHGISKSFGELRAVDDVSIEIADGEFFTIVGPSGSGKSTLVRILAGLDRPDSGNILLRGEDITATPANARPTCMVFQSLALFTHRTVGENIEFSQKMKGVARDARREHALRMMEVVRLPREYYARPVTQCSGGEQQRVALARALASDPEILFFDEPLSAIDYRLRKILEVEMKDLHRRTGKTFIYITHSLEEAMVMSDRIAIMRSGTLIQTGTPHEIYRRPESRFVAEFMGEVNIFTVADGRLAELGIAAAQIEAPYLVVRPEYLRPAGNGDADFRFRAEVTNDYMLGSRTQFHLDAGGTSLVAELPALAAAGIAPGDVGEWGFDRADAVPLAD